MQACQGSISRMSGWALGATALVVGLAIHTPSVAHACGGLFCNSAQPVNQAAERIIFSDNGDGTVTAIIEIQYEGPAEKFAWVLPVPGVPDVDVSSTTALDRLQQSTNPQYTLNRIFECPAPLAPNGGGGGSGGGFATSGTAMDDSGGVSVLASGAVGPFIYDVIMVDPSLSDRAEPALTWLGDNGYDVGDLGPEVLRPYLEQDLNLIAFKLDKNATSGSIRPIRISYDGQKPFIPIRPTAVAANDDMPIMVFVLGDDRAIPREYKALELNEARINWFNPMSTYNEVVSEAANEAAGQGFVTEFAGATDFLDQLVVGQYQREQWREFQNSTFSDPLDMFFQAQNLFYGWEGFDDALRAAVTLPDDLTLQDFIDCPRCYESRDDVVLDDVMLLTEIFERVVKPMFATQDLLDSRPYMTRLYTTMSADEMTTDPSFDFNGDLDDVSNFHTADQYIGCDNEWRVELASGEIVYGEEQNVWPDTSEQPATRRILQLSTSGQGEVVDDNIDKIVELLNESVPPDAMSSGGSGGSGSAGDGSAGSSDARDAGAGEGGSSAAAGESGSAGSAGSDDTSDETMDSSHSSCGCSLPGQTRTNGLAPFMLLGLAVALRRWRRRVSRG